MEPLGDILSDIIKFVKNLMLARKNSSLTYGREVALKVM